MGKVRYSDEKYLCGYDLSVDFFESLGSFGNFIYLLKDPDPSLT